MWLVFSVQEHAVFKTRDFFNKKLLVYFEEKNTGWERELKYKQIKKK